MSKVKHTLKRTVRNYPTIIAVIGRSSVANKTNVNATTKPMTRQKKKRFGIFKKSEE